MALAYVVRIGPVWSRVAPFGMRAADCFQQGDVVQAISVETLTGPVTKKPATWAKLANGTFVCVKQGETDYLVRIAGMIPSREPAQTKPLDLGKLH